MANTALRFFRGANAPATPATGMIWFNTSLNLIQVYNGSEWEKYGKVQDVTFSELKLNVKKSDGTEFTLDFSDVASANGVNASFADLKTRLAGMDTRMDNMDTRMNGIDTTITNLDDELTSAIGDVDDKVDALDTKVGNLPADTTAKNVVEYVDAKVKAASDAATEDLSKEVEALEKALEAEAKTARDAEKANADAIAVEKGRVDTLVGTDANMSARAIVQDEVAKQLDSENISDSFDTLREMAEWLSSHPKDVQDMKDSIKANADAIDAAKEEIYGEIEKNEEVTAQALNDLNDRANSLDGRATSLEGRADALEAINAGSRLSDLETAVNTTLPGAIESAVQALDSNFVAATAEEGKVAVVTGIEIADGKIVSGEGKKTAQTEVYTTGKIDALFEAAMGNGGSVQTQITNALDALDFGGASVTPAKNGVSVIAAVSQENGQITATAVEVEAAGAAAAAIVAVQGTADDAKEAATVAGAKKYADHVAGNAETNAIAAAKSETESQVGAMATTLRGEMAEDLAEAKKYTDDEIAEAVGAYGDNASGLRKEIAERDAAVLSEAKEYASGLVSGKNVSAEGDTYVSASAADNKVTVETNVDAIREYVLTWESFA